MTSPSRGRLSNAACANAMLQLFTAASWLRYPWQSRPEYLRTYFGYVGLDVGTWAYRYLGSTKPSGNVTRPWCTHREELINPCERADPWSGAEWSVFRYDVRTPWERLKWTRIQTAGHFHRMFHANCDVLYMLALHFPRVSWIFHFFSLINVSRELFRKGQIEQSKYIAVDLIPCGIYIILTTLREMMML